MLSGCQTGGPNWETVYYTDVHSGGTWRIRLNDLCAAATLAYRSLVVEWLGLRRRCQHGRVGRWSGTVRWPPGARNRRRSPWAAAASVRTTAACENPVTCTVIKRDTRSRRETQRQGVIEVRTVFYSYLHYMYHNNGASWQLLSLHKTQKKKVFLQFTKLTVDPCMKQLKLYRSYD